MLGPGLRIPHIAFIAINNTAQTGANCTIMPGVLIGDGGGRSPSIGDNVYLGLSTKVLGGIALGRGAHIRAGAVVEKDMPAHTDVDGISARQVPRKSADKP